MRAEALEHFERGSAEVGLQMAYRVAGLVLKNGRLKRSDYFEQFRNGKRGGDVLLKENIFAVDSSGGFGF